jgi:hypothetical protein
VAVEPVVAGAVVVAAGVVVVVFGEVVVAVVAGGATVSSVPAMCTLSPETVSMMLVTFWSGGASVTRNFT